MPFIVHKTEDGSFVADHATEQTLPDGYAQVEVTQEQWESYRRVESVWNPETLALEPIQDQATVVAEREAREAKRAQLVASIATLRQWADQAEATTVTSGNAVATLQTVVNRLGVFFDRFADLLEDRFQ